MGFIFLFLGELQSQKWIVKDSILVFPQGFSSWLQRNNGGVDPANPGPGNSMGKIGSIGTNQGVDLYDFNKDGLPDLTFQLFPSNNVTREYIKGIFIQNTNGKYVLDTNYVIKAKGDLWLGSFGDFNGDGLTDYHYIIQNYHGADSNRKFSPEMINDHWPEKVFINNGKSFDTLTLDVNNLFVESTYTADIDKDGTDEIIATGRYPDVMNVYKYDKSKKQFYKMLPDLSKIWSTRFDPNVSRYPLFNVSNVNNQNEFEVILADSSNSLDLNQPDWQPFNFRKFTYVNYNFNSKIFKTFSLNRDSIFIPVKYSKQDASDYYKFNIHEKLTAYKMDIDKNGEEEIVVGGFYMNNYYVKNTQRYAYGWKVLGLNGKDLTTQFFKDSGIDRGTDLFPLALDIDENAEGVEMIPGTWGMDLQNYVDGSPSLGYYYKIVNGKFEKTVISDLKLESGKKLDSSYFKAMQLIKYPNYKKNKNALLMYDFQDINRASILFQLNCSDFTKPTFSTNKFSFCSGDSLKLSITGINKSDSLKWYFGTKSDLTNVSTKTFSDSTKLFVIRTDSLGCSISSDTISITKNSLPPLPLVKDTVFCQNTSSSTLLATRLSGNSITWYGTSATGGSGNTNAVVATTTDTTTKAYYVSQINNTTSCESPRAKITVKINPAPTTPSVKDTSYCNNINADTLKATPLASHSLSWYGTSATGGTASTFGSKPNTATTGTFSYYVSQINNATGCEGARAKIGVTINPLPNAPSVRDTFYCNNASVDTLRVNPTTGNTILWYGTSATGGTSSNTAIKPMTNVVGTSSYYLSQITSATGCESLRSKLSVTVHPIPAAPILSRDTANSLVSNVGRVTWFKDGTLITDTTQKFKPTSAGSYSVKTTQNGCISAMSSPYYYLVTDIIQLSNGEFIKLTPNPFINFMNIDFVVKGHQRMNIEVFSAATGAKVATRMGVIAGSRLSFSELNPGVYFVRVSSPDFKVSHQFKMVKL
jgi:hypothetical protein